MMSQQRQAAPADELWGWESACLWVRYFQIPGGHDNELRLPFSGLADFKRLLDEMVGTAKGQTGAAFTRPEVTDRSPDTETVLKEGQMKLEKKSFIFQLKENSRGRYMRIIETKKTRLNTFLIPGESLEEFKLWVVDIAKAAKKKPGPTSRP